MVADPAIACQLVVYDDLLQHPTDRFREIARFCDPEVADEEVDNWIEKAKSGNTRKNKGYSGRGRSLSDEAKEQLSRFASYYKNTDFSLVGLYPSGKKRAAG